MAWDSGNLVVRHICGEPPSLHDCRKSDSSDYQRQAFLGVFQPISRKAYIDRSNQWLAFS